MHSAMNDAIDEATGTSMDESMIEHDLYIKNGAGIVLVVIPTERTRCGFVRGKIVRCGAVRCGAVKVNRTAPHRTVKRLAILYLAVFAPNIPVRLD